MILGSTKITIPTFWLGAGMWLKCKLTNLYMQGVQHQQELVVSLIACAPGTGKNVTQFNHSPGEQSYTHSSLLPRPLWECLGPPFSGIGFSVLLGCSLSSFLERSSENLSSCLCSWNTPLLKSIPHPWYPTMVIWVKFLLSSGMNAHQHPGQSSSFKPDWAQYIANITVLQTIMQSASCPKFTGYPFYHGGKMPLCSRLGSLASGSWPISDSW